MYDTMSGPSRRRIPCVCVVLPLPLSPATAIKIGRCAWRSRVRRSGEDAFASVLLGPAGMMALVDEGRGNKAFAQHSAGRTQATVSYAKPMQSRCLAAQHDCCCQGFTVALLAWWLPGR